MPLADQLLLASSDRTYVLSMRKNGYVHAILKHQLQQSAESWLDSCGIDSDGRLPDFTTDLPAGWVPWLVEPLDDDQQRPVVLLSANLLFARLATGIPFRRCVVRTDSLPNE